MAEGRHQLGTSSLSCLVCMLPITWDHSWGSAEAILWVPVHSLSTWPGLPHGILASSYMVAELLKMAAQGSKSKHPTNAAWPFLTHHKEASHLPYSIDLNNNKAISSVKGRRIKPATWSYIVQELVEWMMLCSYLRKIQSASVNRCKTVEI